jgi:hypothetical protein
MQQKKELLELRKFRAQYEHLQPTSGNELQVGLIKTSLAGLKFPATKQNIQTKQDKD